MGKQGRDGQGERTEGERWYEKGREGLTWIFVQAPRAPSYASALCLCLSVTIRCSVETDERIGLVFGTGASFDASYTSMASARG